MIDRAVAVRHIGYGGPSGAADKALATLAHFGLVEKAGKGDVRLTQLAVDVLHPETPAAGQAALLKAGFSPRIFQDIRDRFGDHVSSSALESYLLRSNFLNRAIGPVIKSYMETMDFLKQMEAFESGGQGQSEGLDSQSDEIGSGADMDDLLVQERAAEPVRSPAVLAERGETEWMRNPLGRDKSVRVLVTGSMGGKEIGKLIKLLEAQKAILDDEDDEDSGDF